MCVCVCVCEREREKRERVCAFLCLREYVCECVRVCVCVCVREREVERCLETPVQIPDRNLRSDCVSERFLY